MAPIAAKRAAAPPWNFSCGGPYLADHLDAGPEDSLRLAGAERLHRRFFRGEARREGRGEIALGAAIGDFAVGEDAPDETVAVSLDRLGNARDFGRVEPGSYNVHRVISTAVP